MRYREIPRYVEAHQADRNIPVNTHGGMRLAKLGNWIVTREDGMKFIFSDEAFGKNFEAAPEVIA